MAAKLTRRERERQRHRKEILESACEVFAEKGYRKSTIQDVAARSEFSVASIYRHFESKEDIYHSLIEDTLQEYVSALRRKTQALDSPLQRLVRALDVTFEIVERKLVFLKFLLAEFRPNLDGDSGTVSSKSAQMYLKVVQFFTDNFQEAIEKKEVVSESPLHLTISLLGMVYSYINYTLATGPQDLHESLQREKAALKKIFFGPVALKKIPREK